MCEFPFKDLRDLKENWDSYGAAPIDEGCIQKAYEVWRQLSGDYQVVPTSEGGIQLEQHKGGFDITVCVSSAPRRGGEPNA